MTETDVAKKWMTERNLMQSSDIVHTDIFDPINQKVNLQQCQNVPLKFINLESHKKYWQKILIISHFTWRRVAFVKKYYGAHWQKGKLLRIEPKKKLKAYGAYLQERKWLRIWPDQKKKWQATDLKKIKLLWISTTSFDHGGKCLIPLEMVLPSWIYNIIKLYKVPHRRGCSMVTIKTNHNSYFNKLNM